MNVWSWYGPLALLPPRNANIAGFENIHPYILQYNTQWYKKSPSINSVTSQFIPCVKSYANSAITSYLAKGKKFSGSSSITGLARCGMRVKMETECRMLGSWWRDAGYNFFGGSRFYSLWTSVIIKLKNEDKICIHINIRLRSKTM